jgi:deazaflavin-dependent oxidoreductase (nitroreductase family)
MNELTFRRWLYRGRRPNWLARMLNRVDAAVGSLGIASRYGLVTLEVTGRASGRPVSLPLVMVVVDGRRYLASMLGDDVQWVKNVRAAHGKATLHCGGYREQVRLEETPPDQRAPILRAYLQRAPGARAHIPVDKEAPLADFERIAPAYPVFRVASLAPEIRGTATDAKVDEKRLGSKHELRHLGATPLGVWLIKHVLSPLDRLLYRWTSGHSFWLGHALAPRLLLTTTGRRTGLQRTVPIFYLGEGDRLIICNVNPGFEQTNPWTLNLRAHPVARVRTGSTSGMYRAREATAEEVARYWPHLVEIWPAYQTHYDRSGQRSIFILEPM